jgi:hypothetical protein
MAPVDRCHCITHYPLLVRTVFGGMHIQTACSTEISLKSPTISQVLLDVYVILCSTQVENLKHAHLN